MKDISNLRQEIDDIDQQLVALFEQRMLVCDQVADFKIETGKKVLDSERERQKIQNVKKLAHSEFNQHGVEELFEQIMSMSRKLQYIKLAEHGVLNTLPFEKIQHLKEQPTVVFQGTSGAYSEIAAISYFGETVKRFSMETWRDAMTAIADGKAEYAVLPIENSSAGIVSQIYDLLVEFDTYIVGEQVVKIEHALLGVPGSQVEDITAVYSHQQALMQCEPFLNEHRKMKAVTMENTAVAALKVWTDGKKNQAAIASKEAARLYGLEILEEKINYNSENSTRFIIVAKDKVYQAGAKKISICFELPHESGSLYHSLSHFIFNNLNMTKIESRPIPGRNWEYRFFIDFEGNFEDSAVKNTLQGLSEETLTLKILGNY